ISSVLATFTKWVILLASCLLLPTFRYGRSAPAVERREELRCGLVKACRCSFPIRQPHTPAIVEESWELQSQDGDSIQLQIQCVRGTMTSSKAETAMYSAAKPDFYRIYRSEQSSDVVRDSESDRVQTFVFKASGPKPLPRRCSRRQFATAVYPTIWNAS